MLNRVSIALPIALLISVTFLQAANYYVDFDAGNNSSAGTSTGTAWKHCPGDANATGTAASTTPTSGDTVNFKGGVYYRGRVVLKRAGVTFQTGSGWGTGRAVLSGADTFSATWTNCTASSQVFGNANYANIWVCAIPSGFTNIWHRMFQGGELLHLSQGPSPSDPFNWDRISEEWYLADGQISRTALTNSTILTSASSTYYDGAWVGIWVQGNLASLQAITSFSPASDSIGYTLADPHATYTDSASWRFSIINHPALIDAAGEYCVMTNENKIYFWPKNGANPNSVTMSVAARKNIFHTSTSDITEAADGVSFINLEMRNTYAHPIDDSETESGGAINIALNREGNITVTNCVFRDFSSPEVGGHVIYLLSSGFGTIINNWFSNSISRGIMVNFGSTNLIASNSVVSLNGTTMEVWNTTNTTIIGNVIDKNTGCHANAITAYDGNDGVFIRKNKVSNSIRMLTFQACRNIEISNNLFDGSGIGSIHEWNSTMGGYIRVLNNSIIQGESGLPVLYLNSSTATYVVQNNIIDGLTGGGATHTYNIYTEPAYTPTLSTGESTNTVVALIPGYASGNYMIAPDIASGYARDAGTDVSAYGVTDDYSGTTRSGAFDIGAYEYSSGGGASGASVPAIIAPGGPRPNRGGTF